MQRDSTPIVFGLVAPAEPLNPVDKADQNTVAYH